MDITNLSITELLNMSISKIGELLKINNINFANLTSGIISTIFLLLTSSFVLWLLKAIGLYKMAKRNNDDLAFLAFIPYACLYTHGKIVGKTTLFGLEIDHPEYLLPLLTLALFLPFGKAIASILLIVFYFGILFRIYQKQTSKFALLLLLLSLILPISIPFIIFFIRNNNNNAKEQA